MSVRPIIEKKSVKVLAIIMLLFLFFNVFSIPKPFILDEPSFVEAANAINNKGVPIFYEGEEAREKVGLWHPPLYIYLLALSFKIFGVSEVSAHLVGTVLSLCTIFLIYLLSLEVFKEDQKKYLIALASSFIYSINPFVLQSAILVDIDTSILVFLMVLFFYVFLRTIKIRYINRTLILGILFGALIWTKFGTPIFMILSIFIFYMINREYKKAFIDSFSIGLIGIIFFLITWLLYCNITDMSFLLPFQHNMATGSFGETGVRLLMKMLWGIKNISFWITLPFILLMGITLLERIQKFLKFKNLKNVDLLLICGMTIFIAYSIIRTNAYGFPKYYAPSIPFFSILIAELAIRSEIIETFKKKYISCLICSGIVFVFLFYIVGDPLLFPYKQEFAILTYKNILTPFIILSIYKTIIYILPIFIFFIFLNLVSKKSSIPISKLITLSLIFALITTSIYVDTVQSQAKYSTTYNYGERGLIETALYIQKHTDTNDTILGETDIGYYSKRPYYRAFLIGPSPDKLQELLNSNNLTYLVFRSNDLWNNEFIDVINSNYILVNRIGSFEIYKKKEI